MSVRRRIVREKAMQALYAHEMSGESVESVLENIVSELKKHKESFEFARSLILKVIETSTELDQMIKDRVKNWEFNRLAVIDKVILRIGICELLYFEDIPPKVSINEAIEIARTYSTEKSDKFVNGVLDSVLDDLRTSGRLKKTGRGLVESSPSKKPAE